MSLFTGSIDSSRSAITLKAQSSRRSGDSPVSVRQRKRDSVGGLYWTWGQEADQARENCWLRNGHLGFYLKLLANFNQRDVDVFCDQIKNESLCMPYFLTPFNPFLHAICSQRSRQIRYHRKLYWQPRCETALQACMSKNHRQWYYAPVCTSQYCKLLTWNLPTNQCWKGNRHLPQRVFLK